MYVFTVLRLTLGRSSGCFCAENRFATVMESKNVMSFVGSQVRQDDPGQVVPADTHKR